MFLKSNLESPWLIILGSFEGGYRAVKDYIGLHWKYFGLLEGRLSEWLIIMGYFKPIMVYFGVYWPVISSYLAVQVGVPTKQSFQQSLIKEWSLNHIWVSLLKIIYLEV